MDQKVHFLRMFNYDHLANLACLTALGPADPPRRKVLGLLAHTLAAQKLWLERLQGVDQSVAVWPIATLEGLAILSSEMDSAWTEYLGALTSTDFDKSVDYRNSKGEPWSSRVEDVLTHVLIHSAHHRGQVALEMRAAGLVPAYIDFIHFVRQGHVK
jgi:uncharacterized damage-inducible protein DinB